MHMNVSYMQTAPKNILDMGLVIDTNKVKFGSNRSMIVYRKD